MISSSVMFGETFPSPELYNNLRRFIQSIKFGAKQLVLGPSNCCPVNPFSKPVWSIRWQGSSSSLPFLDIETVLESWCFGTSIVSPITLPSPRQYTGRAAGLCCWESPCQVLSSSLQKQGFARSGSFASPCPSLRTHPLLRLLLLSRFSRVWLCDPIDGSPPGSAVPGILQARTLEWVAISSSHPLLGPLRFSPLRDSGKQKSSGPKEVPDIQDSKPSLSGWEWKEVTHFYSILFFPQFLSFRWVNRK